MWGADDVRAGSTQVRRLAERIRGLAAAVEGTGEVMWESRAADSFRAVTRSRALALRRVAEACDEVSLLLERAQQSPGAAGVAGAAGGH